MEERKSELTCPECRDRLTEFQRGEIREYRCRVGHAYSTLSLAQDHQDTIERSCGKLFWRRRNLRILPNAWLEQTDATNGQAANIRHDQALIIQEMLKGEPTQTK